MNTQMVVLSDVYTTYNVIFTMNQETYDNGKIVFELGEVNGDVTTTALSIEAVNIVKLDSIINLDLWNIWEADEWSGPGSGTLDVTGSELTIDVTGVGNAYSPQVFLDGLSFENGQEYVVMFEASSLEFKTINVNIGMGLDVDPWWLAYASTYTFVFDTTPQLYAYSFVMTEE